MLLRRSLRLFLVETRDESPYMVSKSHRLLWPLLRKRVIRWAPLIAVLVGSDMADAREGKMATGDPTVVLCRHLQYTLTLTNSLARVRVEGARECRIGKLHRSHEHQVAHHNECLAL